MLGHNIRDFRKQKGLKQTELAEGIVTRSYLSLIEKGDVQPSYDVVEQLSVRLGTTVNELYRDDTNKELLISQIKRFIKITEKHVESNDWDRVKSFDEDRKYMVHPNVNAYERGILQWIYGKIEEQRGEFSKAMDHYKQSIDIFEEEQFNEELVRSLDSLGVLLRRQNQYLDALYAFQQAYELLTIHHIVGVRKIAVLSHLGNIHAQLKEFYCALNFLNKAIEVSEKAGSFSNAGDIFMTMSACYIELKEVDKVKESSNRALHFYRLSKDRLYEAHVLSNLGVAHMKTNHFEEAYVYFTDSLNLYIEINAKTDILNNTKIEISRCLVELNRSEEAIAYCTEVVNSTENARYLAQAHELLGDTYNGKDEEASLQHYLQAKKSFDDSDRKRISKKLASHYHNLKAFEKAIVYYQECVRDL